MPLAGVTKPVAPAALCPGSSAAYPFANAPAIGFSAAGKFLSGKGAADKR